MGNFGGGNFPQNNPPSLFGGGMHPQQRGQTGMAGMGGGTNPSFGMSNMQTNSLQQQAHNQFMMHRQGNVAYLILSLVELSAYSCAGNYPSNDRFFFSIRDE